MLTNATISILSSQLNVYQIMVLIILRALVILGLLRVATTHAKTVAGAIGEWIVGGLKAAIGLALGAAAIGTGLALRGTVGAFMKGASTGDTAAARMEEEQRTGQRDPTLTRWQRISGRIAQRTGIHGLQQRLGRNMAVREERIEESRDARHHLNEAVSGVTGGKVTDWNKATGRQRWLARRQIERNSMAKEAAAANRHNRTTWAELSEGEKRGLTPQIEQNLNQNNTYADTNMIRAARRTQTILDSVAYSATVSSFDPRNLEKLVAGEHEHGMTKVTKALLAVAAINMRNGLRAAGIQHGEEVHGDAMKDIGHTISNAMQSANIKIDLSGLGKEHKDAGAGAAAHH
jgi:hypothetical protein